MNGNDDGKRFLRTCFPAESGGGGCVRNVSFISASVFVLVALLLHLDECGTKLHAGIPLIKSNHVRVSVSMLVSNYLHDFIERLVT